MNNLYKGKAKYIFLGLTASLFMLITTFGRGELFDSLSFHKSLTPDTIPKPKKVVSPLSDSTKKLLRQAFVDDSIRNSNNPKLRIEAPDTGIVPKIDTISIKFSKDSLDGPIVYHADDSMVLDVPAKKLYLYGDQTKTNYLNNELTAPFIMYDQRTSVVSAHLTKDSSGNVLRYVKFVQDDFITHSDSLSFNMLTQKGITKGTYFKQGEDMYVHAEKSKKVDVNTIYALRTRFTTCNYDTPHYAFVAQKVKFINKKVAFTGPVHPEVEGVPLPIVLPFGIYPLSQGRHSGVIAPTFTANEQLGLALEGLGYYKVLSDNWDVTTRGTIYSYGGWTANISPRYFKRYHYQGNFSLNVQHFNFGLKSDPGFNKTRSFLINWSHTADTKSRPGVTFNANVSAGSSKFNAYVPGSPARNFQNQLTSSIAWAKTWTSENKLQTYNLSINANHNQNTLLKQINLNLPDIAFSVNTQYPFRRKEVVDYKWFENIGVALNSNARSLSSFSDSANAPGIFTQISNNLQWGATHSVPITLSLPQIGVFQVLPSVTYQEKWYQQKIIRNWNPGTKQVDITYDKGFFTARDMSYNLDFSTRIFGMYQFDKDSRVQAIRHEIRPSFGFSYHPDFNSQFFRNSQVDTFGTIAHYSVFEGTVPGPFGEGVAGNLTFSIDNNIQMKVKSKKDTGEAAIKKITLLDGLSMTTAYNLLADSFGLAVFSLGARTNLFDKININASAILDPYDISDQGLRVKYLLWKRKPLSFGRLTSANVSLSSQFQGGEKKTTGTQVTNADKLQRLQYDPNTGLPLDEYNQELAYISNNPGEFADFNIPWSLSVAYTMSYTKLRNLALNRFENKFNQDANFNGDLNLTPKWKIGINGAYSISNKELGLLSMYLTREMHCWQMSINISPVGTYRYFNISISPKSGLLRDLKINRTRSFYDL